jgi:hypothetical protein
VTARRLADRVDAEISREDAWMQIFRTLERDIAEYGARPSIGGLASALGALAFELESREPTESRALRAAADALHKAEDEFYEPNGGRVVLT